MDRTEIKELVKEVLGPNTQLVDHTKWVSMCCPLARWTHVGGADSSPSSGISVKEDGVSIFHCWGCGSKGTVPWLLKELEKYTGEDYRSIIRTLEDGEYLGGSLPEWGTARKEKVEERILDSEYLDLYDSAVGHWYLRERGILKSTARDLGLLVDPCDSEGDERILFPVFNRHEQLVGFTGRAVLDKARLRVRDYHGFQKAYSLLGVHLIDPEDPYIVVVEGLFDFAKVYQYGYSTVATLHAGLTEGQARILEDIGKPLVLMYDNDQAGRTATEAAEKLLGRKLPLSVAKYYPRGVKGSRRKEECPKDPGMCTMEEIDKMVDKARIL